MDDIIEASIETPDGIADCNFEPLENDGLLYYNVTILYPNTVNGYSRPEVYCHNMYKDDAGHYHFDQMDENIHPKIKKLEGLLSDIITSG